MKTQRQSIWAVDDNQPDLDILKMVLEGVDVDVRTFTGANELINVLQAAAKSTLPDLVLLDVNMPGLSGIDIVERLRSDPKLSGLRVCVLTGSQMPKEKVLLEALGAGCVLRKPHNVAEFETLRANLKAVLGADPGRAMYARDDA